MAAKFSIFPKRQQFAQAVAKNSNFPKCATNISGAAEISNFKKRTTKISYFPKRAHVLPAEKFDFLKSRKFVAATPKNWTAATAWTEKLNF